MEIYESPIQAPLSQRAGQLSDSAFTALENSNYQQAIDEYEEAGKLWIRLRRDNTYCYTQISLAKAYFLSGDSKKGTGVMKELEAMFSAGSLNESIHAPKVDQFKDLKKEYKVNTRNGKLPIYQTIDDLMEGQDFSLSDDSIQAKIIKANFYQTELFDFPSAHELWWEIADEKEIVQKGRVLHQKAICENNMARFDSARETLFNAISQKIKEKELSESISLSALASTFYFFSGPIFIEPGMHYQMLKICQDLAVGTEYELRVNSTIAYHGETYEQHFVSNCNQILNNLEISSRQCNPALAIGYFGANAACIFDVMGNKEKQKQVLEKTLEFLQSTKEIEGNSILEKETKDLLSGKQTFTKLAKKIKDEHIEKLKNEDSFFSIYSLMRDLTK
jgi:tetratricopeptide (TPR) repeat protein